MTGKDTVSKKVEQGCTEFCAYACNAGSRERKILDIAGTRYPAQIGGGDFNVATRQVSKCEQTFYGQRFLVDVEEIKTRIAVREMGTALSNRTGDTTLRGIANRIGISHMTLHRLYTGGSIGADGMKRILHWVGAELTDVAKPIKSHAGSIISNVSEGVSMSFDGMKEPIDLFELEEVS